MKSYAILLFLLVFVFLSGCTLLGQQQPTDQTKYKNDIITVEHTTISNSNPYPGSTTSLQILLKNNGDKSVDNLRIEFDNIVGLELKELRCEEGIREDSGCVFNGFGSLETRIIKLTLKVPEHTIKNPFVEYEISYPWKGYREARIPIVNDISVTPKAKFSQTPPSLGPVLLEFEFPAQRTTTIDKQIIKEYWVISDEPFELKIKVRYVGTITNYEPIMISKSDFAINLNNNFEKEPNLYCEFEEVGNNLYPKEDLKVPAELICNLRPLVISEFESIAPISAEFSYTFKFRRKEVFTVKEILR
ncbi:MAG: hypothetical protein QXS48_01720 [Candidatus Aenigmatarchaeota archaeon]